MERKVVNKSANDLINHKNATEDLQVIKRHCSKLKNNDKVKNPVSIKLSPRRKKNIADSLPIPKRSQSILKDDDFITSPVCDKNICLKENTAVMRGKLCHTF